MIEKMDKYSWILLSSDKDSFIDFLSSLGVVDITRSSKPVDSHSERLLNDINELNSEIRTIESGENDHIRDLRSRIKDLVQEAEASSVWGTFDTGMLEKLSSAGIDVDFYCVQEKHFDNSWESIWPLSVISRSKGKVWFVVAGAEDFPLKPIPAPSRTESEVREEISLLDSALKKEMSALAVRKSEIPELKKKVDILRNEMDVYLASLQVETAAENSLTVFEGFAPSAEKERLCAAFDEAGVCYFCENALCEDNPPIKLRNNKFVSMFEPLTDMYGRPTYDGFDPTPFISIFFLLFFAMCMGDMGYGLILFAISFVLKKAGNFSKFSPLVCALGIGTVLIGFLFHTFFSIDFYNASFVPDWARTVMVPPQIAGYDGTMILSLAIGIVHLCLAMIVKTVNYTKNKGFLESLGTWGWTLLFVGAVVIGVFALSGVIDNRITKIALVSLGIICAVGIFPLNNIHRNPLKNVGSGLWDAYNMATGILGDVLSYLRLYALGLAGAMLGYAFNDLAKMALGDGGAGWIAFILIVIIGHTLNLAMAALGAFVHPLRLNFLEFFKNSGYEGSGNAYSPLKK